MSFTPKPNLIIDSTRAALDAGETVNVKITSNSMSPLIKNGDFVSITRKNFASISVGDIIVLESDGGLLTHRLVDRGSNTLITRGDRNSKPDPIADIEQIVGIVTSLKRADGSINLLNGSGYIISRSLFRLSQMEHLWETSRFFRNFIPNCSVLFYGLARLIAHLV